MVSDDTFETAWENESSAPYLIVIDYQRAKNGFQIDD